ncbi:hypothetical protein [Companilactobacillus paralimentarius]|uniref:hypothetical protein n=1 Tax=Companilactobacillus paralimentarius TaxID=83526 RepID=UPI0037DFE20E
MNTKQKHLIRTVSFPLVGEGTEYDDPKRFLELSSWKQIKLINWILDNLEPSKGINQNYSSYGLKHFFSNDEVDGFYIKNGAFKGAMLVAGFKVANKDFQNWNFNIKTKSITKLNKI